MPARSNKLSKPLTPDAKFTPTSLMTATAAALPTAYIERATDGNLILYRPYAYLWRRRGSFVRPPCQRRRPRTEFPRSSRLTKRCSQSLSNSAASLRCCRNWWWSEAPQSRSRLQHGQHPNRKKTTELPGIFVLSLGVSGLPKFTPTSTCYTPPQKIYEN